MTGKFNCCPDKSGWGVPRLPLGDLHSLGEGGRDLLRDFRVGQFECDLMPSKMALKGDEGSKELQYSDPNPGNSQLSTPAPSN
ncbi:hypothetical protein TNCV_1218281 [Trichonephila clavipes]|nr:hypothetical protein TNCV_1218281 [Trichonephila clavipes]